MVNKKIRKLAQDYFNECIKSNAKCPLDSYEAGTFKCDPAESEAKEDDKSGRRGKVRDKSGGSTGSGSGRTDGKRGSGRRSGTGGTGSGSKKDDGGRVSKIEGLGRVRVESLGKAKVEALKQIDILRENASDLQRISTIKDARDFLEKKGGETKPGESPVKKISGLLKDNEFRSLCIFDRARIAAQLERGDRAKEYVGMFRVAHNKGGNMKMTEALKVDGKEFRIVGADTVQGCDQMCYECYANKIAAKSKIKHQVPVKAALNGSLYSDEILRVGTNGEPAKDWGHTALQVKDLIKRSNKNGQNVSAAGNIFFISKMLNIDEWDPEVIKNVKVSMDPLYPDHMRQTMINVMRIKAQYPDTNFALRIRSIASKDPGIMMVQEDAVEFANTLGLPVLETKLRFQKSDVTTKLLDLDYNRDPEKSMYVKHEFISEKSGKLTKENQLKLKNPVLKGKANNLRVCNEKNLGTGACAACHACYDLMIQPATRKANIEASKVAMSKLDIDLSKFEDPSKLDVSGYGEFGARGIKTTTNPKIRQIKGVKQPKKK